jgi:hypothetical protein
MQSAGTTLRVVAANVDTALYNVKGELPVTLVDDLEALKARSQETDEDLATPWTFAGETLHIKPHGSGRQWRWILHCPSLHLDIGLGKLNGTIAKARLSAALLWEHGPDVALTLLYAFLVGWLGKERFRLQVSEVHLCVDVAGWDLSLADADAFVSRSRARTSRLVHPDDEECSAAASAQEDAYTAPSVTVHTNGRMCTGFEFSKKAPHSCVIYDKTRELARSRKDWMRAVWEAHGWDGQSRVIRVEFRYERECLREMEVEEAYAFLDQVPGLWAYSTRGWLRHTLPDPSDANKARWPVSPVWRLVERAEFFGAGTPAVRTRKTAGDLRLICQMLAGCSTTAAAFLAGQLPETDDGSVFFRWFYDWMLSYLDDKGQSFELVREGKRLRLGVVSGSDDPAA